VYGFNHRRIFAAFYLAGIRAKVAANKLTPPDTLRQLALDPYSSVAWSVATNPSTPPETLRTLSTIYSFHNKPDTDWKHPFFMGLREGLADNPSTPLAVTIQLKREIQEERERLRKQSIKSGWLDVG